MRLFGFKDLDDVKRTAFESEWITDSSLLVACYKASGHGDYYGYILIRTPGGDLMRQTTVYCDLHQEFHFDPVGFYCTFPNVVTEDLANQSWMTEEMKQAIREVLTT